MYLKTSFYIRMWDQCRCCFFSNNLQTTNSKVPRVDSSEIGRWDLRLRKGLSGLGIMMTYVIFHISYYHCLRKALFFSPNGGHFKKRYYLESPIRIRIKHIIIEQLQYCPAIFTDESDRRACYIKSMSIMGMPLFNLNDLSEKESIFRTAPIPVVYCRYPHDRKRQNIRIFRHHHWL